MHDMHKTCMRYMEYASSLASGNLLIRAVRSERQPPEPTSGVRELLAGRPLPIQEAKEVIRDDRKHGASRYPS